MSTNRPRHHWGKGYVLGDGQVFNGKAETVSTNSEPKSIREFHGDNVWRDEEGTIWMRLDESIAMQKFAWDQGYGDDLDCREPRVNPYSNALISAPTTEE